METILVVDDESSVREMMATMLLSSERDIKMAENGVQAEEILASSEISLVVTDIVMDGVNGIDLIMKMKTDYPDIPIVAVSGGGGIEGRFDYLEIAKLVGANKILKKPFTAEILRTMVNESLG